VQFVIQIVNEVKFPFRLFPPIRDESFSYQRNSIPRLPVHILFVTNQKRRRRRRNIKW